jgi:hypothetical protein
MPIILGPAPAGSPTWVFDSTDVDASNTPLDLSAGNYGVELFEAPMPQPDVLYASSVDTEGENPASVRFRNRPIRMVIHCGSGAAVSDLEHKVAKLIREKGTLLYTTVDDLPIVFDVLTVDTFDVPVDDTSVLNGYYVVQLSLTCRPFGYGFEVDLGDNTETTLPWLIWTEAAVPGTWFARGRLVIDNDQAADMHWAIWGVRSRHYSAAASAALAFQAESCTVTSGAIATGPAGSSGGASNNTVRNQALTSGVWDTTIVLGTGSAPRTSHIGAYRVFTRVQAPNTNTGTVSVRLEWGPGTGTVTNTAVSIDPSYEGTWRILDLGMIDIPERPVGASGWDGSIVATSSAATGDIYFDWVMLVPVEESSGEVLYNDTTGLSAMQASASLQVAHDSIAAQGASGGTSWYKPNFRGDYLRIPPAGAEGRTAEIIVKLSRGLPLEEADSATDDLSAHLHVTPLYLEVPAA